MSQERLDQTCRLPLGTRDAIHMPIVSAQAAHGLDYKTPLTPGSFVKFVDDEFTRFVPCEKSEAHGFLNPCINEISRYENVIVMLMPGITSPVRHNFDINPKQRDWEACALEAELEHAKREDPDCAGCWVIRNNQVIRN